MYINARKSAHAPQFPQHVCADPEVTSYKLELVASRLGVELDDAHDAAADVTATLDILGVYTSRLRQTEGTATAMQKKEKTRKYFKI